MLRNVYSWVTKSEYESDDETFTPGVLDLDEWNGTIITRDPDRSKAT